MSREPRWHHSPDAPPEHFCADCEESAERIQRLEEALSALVKAAECVPYHRNPLKGVDEPCSYPLEGHREYSCPMCIALDTADDLLGANRGWEHPYEMIGGTDMTCIHCGQVGSYIHTKPEDR